MTKTRSGRRVSPKAEIGRAGEAVVYTIRENANIAFKEYHAPTPEREQKLKAMLAAPPTDPTVSSLNHHSIAWPLDVVDDVSGKFCGFVMPRISRAATLATVAHPRDRRRLGWRWTWRHLLRVAQHLSGAIAALHAAGYVIGDMNSQNVLVTEDALITVIDCDSMQIRGDNGQLHRCPVGTADYTAPELTARLHGKQFKDIDRNVESDNFALAILIYQLLLEGTHPYQGRWQPAGDPPARPDRMRKGLFSHGPDRRVAPSPYAPPFDICPPELRALFSSAFVAGASNPDQRPTAREWEKGLAAADKQLQACKRNPHHIYTSHRRHCPWCERIQATGIDDPFPSKTRHLGTKKLPQARGGQLPKPKTTAPTPRIPTLAPATGPSPPRGLQLAVDLANKTGIVLGRIIDFGRAVGAFLMWLVALMFYLVPLGIIALNVFAWYLILTGRPHDITEFAESSMRVIWEWDARWALHLPIVVIWGVMLLITALALFVEGLIVLIAMGIIWLIGQTAESIFSMASVPDLRSLVTPLLQNAPFR